MLLAAAIGGVFKFRDIFSGEPARQNQSSDSPVSEQQTVQEESDTEQPPVTPPPAPAKPEVTGPTEGVGTLAWVVNKSRPLNPKTYVPPNLVLPQVKQRVPGTESMKLRADTATAAEQLFAAAGSAGYSPMLSSGYRSYATQNSVYNSYVAQDGQAAADTYSARPGHSEHQTGLAFDICNASACSLEEAFSGTPLGKWVAAHAHEYGFIIRYPSGKQHITGYTYEPWHLRHVGTSLAAQIYQSGKTLEEHFGLPAAPTYP